MISDCSLLGIEETEDLALIKSAYRRRVKELHPDLAAPGDALRNHDLFVQVCAAYRRLLAHARPASGSLGAEGPDGAGGVDPGRDAAPSPPRTNRGGQVAAYSDPAYAFYKAGMKHFMRIHPSQWNIDDRMLNTRIAGDDAEQEAIRRRVMELVKLFPRAYYYFGIVVNEYPRSDWAFDAREKMGTIEERIGRYRKIIESFSTWNVDAEELRREYRERVDGDNERLKAARRDMPKDW
jgi:hypothetical protein